jgi:hypothetical protein
MVSWMLKKETSKGRHVVQKLVVFTVKVSIVA